jgi:cytoplasmic FMR1 interacting protein
VPQDLWGSKAIQTVFHAIHSLYTSFIGTQHLKLINKYLGYQGIAMIIDDFTKLIVSIIDGKLTEELIQVQKSIKRSNFNLPLYDYGSTAILTLFYDQLVNVIKSPDLRSNVFHLFTQIGNAIIFSLLLEQQLVSIFIYFYIFEQKKKKKKAS